MNYRVLKSVAHNFSHSFLSLLNYVDDGHVIDDLYPIVRQSNGRRVSIYWVPASGSQSILPPRVLKSIALHRKWLPDLVQREGSRITAIREFRTDIYLSKRKTIAVEAHLIDDRGMEHVSIFTI